jgi:NTP pyrophosphatase (non-canonical NTP hydrolase)
MFPKSFKKTCFSFIKLLVNVQLLKMLSLFLHKRKNQNFMTISEAQQIVDEWINSTGVRYFNELTNMAILTEEVGEVARIIARKYGEQSFKESDKDKDLGDEFADVLFVLICLANQTGIDLTEALKKNLEKKTNRDELRHRNNEKLR